jgi:hypothetical protein
MYNPKEKQKGVFTCMIAIKAGGRGGPASALRQASVRFRSTSVV